MPTIEDDMDAKRFKHERNRIDHLRFGRYVKALEYIGYVVIALFSGLIMWWQFWR